MTGAARPHMWYYYSGDNFGRKEPQLVSFFERDEKEPVVWESRRGDYDITLWRTVDVGNFDVDAEVTSWDKLRVRYQGKTVCKVEGGNWVDTARCCPERAVIKIWRYDDLESKTRYQQVHPRTHATTHPPMMAKRAHTRT